MSITEFARRYASLNYPHDHALMRRVYFTDVSTSTLVWREDEFLVELYFMHPLAKVVAHSHPFENLAIHVGGRILGRRSDMIGRWLTDADRGQIGAPLRAGGEHAFDVGDAGAVFYNVSRWDDPAEQDSATVKYIGEPLGPLHASSIGAKQSPASKS